MKVAFDDGVWYAGSVVSCHWGWRRFAYTYDIAFDTGYKLGPRELPLEGSILAEDEPEPAAAARPVDEAVKRKRDEHWAQLREVTKAARKEVGEVESIQASREPVDRSSEKEYLVKWKGFDEKYNTWRKASELADMRVQALIDEFEAAPEAPGADVTEVCV